LKANHVDRGLTQRPQPSNAVFRALAVRDDGIWDVSLQSVPYDGSRLLRDYEKRKVPARGTILRIFHGVSHM